MPKSKRTVPHAHNYERPISSYDRRAGNRLPGRCILIVCEGAETEPNYFEKLKAYLKLSTVQVKVKNRAGAPITLVNEASMQVEKRNQEIRERKNNLIAFEAVWCVFDVENPYQNPTFDQAVKNPEQRNYNLAISNPAFEYWFILHFDQTTRPFGNGEELKDYLRRYIPTYQESTPVFEKLVRSTAQAIKRAKIISQAHDQNKRFPNPSTQVYLLVEEMIEMSPSNRELLR